VTRLTSALEVMSCDLVDRMGTIWTRPGLELKQRSLINIALLESQNYPAEVRPPFSSH
jgi:alkylhydroperoxidase/carboxymuconolactone decarboxylase family protein YurZ